MRNHEDNKRKGEKQLEQDWRINVKISDAYVTFKDNFIKILSGFEPI